MTLHCLPKASDGKNGRGTATAIKGAGSGRSPVRTNSREGKLQGDFQVRAKGKCRGFDWENDWKATGTRLGYALETDSPENSRIRIPAMLWPDIPRRPSMQVHDTAESDSKHPYSDQFIAEIMAEFRIPTEHAEKLKSLLNQAARVYRLSRDVPTTEHLLFEKRKGLEHVDETYSAFAQSLESLSHHSRDRLWDPAFADPVWRRVPSALAQLDANNYPDETTFKKTLDDFGKRIRERLDDLPKITLSGGQPRNDRLHYWVGLVARFWSEKLDRKFTYSQAPKRGSAYDFCWLVLQRMDAGVTPSKLKTAMRGAIPSRKHANRKPGKRTKRLE